jgi:hypothetical protein
VGDHQRIPIVVCFDPFFGDGILLDWLHIGQQISLACGSTQGSFATAPKKFSIFFIDGALIRSLLVVCSNE